MEELGFRENASEGVKKAFLQNLIKAAYPKAPIDLPLSSTKKKAEPEQLSFELEKKDVSLLKTS
jgi:hypothetical protein